MDHADPMFACSPSKGGMVTVVVRDEAPEHTTVTGGEVVVAVARDIMKTPIFPVILL